MIKATNLNKDLFNTVFSKAIPCNLRAEMKSALEGYLRHANELARTAYDTCFSRYFDGIDKPECTGACIKFLYDYNILVPDIYIDIPVGGAIMAHVTNDGNGMLLPFLAKSKTSPVGILQVIYRDMHSLRVFTPFQGNPVNAIMLTALGCEHDFYENKMMPDIMHNAVSTGSAKMRDLAEKIYPRGTERRPDGHKIYTEYFGLEFGDLVPDVHAAMEEARAALL